MLHFVTSLWHRCRKADTRERVADKGPDALIEQRGHTLILTLNRPEARNALSTEMLSIMVEAWDRVDNDPEIRTCILTGAGGYFCAGMDLKAATAKPAGRLVQGRQLRPVAHRRPAQGPPADQAADRRRRGPGHRGRHRDPAGHRHPRRRRERQVRHLRGQVEPVPDGRLRGAAGRARSPTPSRATCCSPDGTSPPPRPRRSGLIGYVVPDGTALDKALEIAEVINNNGPLAVQAILKTIRETEGMHENDAFKIDTQIGIAVFLSDDAKEGPLAFKEKRAPELPDEVTLPGFTASRFHIRHSGHRPSRATSCPPHGRQRLLERHCRSKVGTWDIARPRDCCDCCGSLPHHLPIICRSSGGASPRPVELACDQGIPGELDGEYGGDDSAAGASARRPGGSGRRARARSCARRG